MTITVIHGDCQFYDKDYSGQKLSGKCFHAHGSINSDERDKGFSSMASAVGTSYRYSAAPASYTPKDSINTISQANAQPVQNDTQEGSGDNYTPSSGEGKPAEAKSAEKTVNPNPVGDFLSGFLSPAEAEEGKASESSAETSEGGEGSGEEKTGEAQEERQMPPLPPERFSHYPPASVGYCPPPVQKFVPPVYPNGGFPSYPMSLGSPIGLPFGNFWPPMPSPAAIPGATCWPSYYPSLPGGYCQPPVCPPIPSSYGYNPFSACLPWDSNPLYSAILRM